MDNANYAAALIDLDGTVYRGTAPIQGAAEGITALREAGLDIRFLTNRATYSRKQICERLNAMHIDAAPDEIHTAGTLTAHYLSTTMADNTVFIVGSDALVTALQEKDITLVDDPTSADVLVASITDDLTYTDINQGLAALDNGATLIGTNPDRTVPTSAGREPGTGMVIAAFEAMTEKDATIIGKPSRTAAQTVLDDIGATANTCLMIGDNPRTDILMANNTGMIGVLVLTGNTTADDVGSLAVSPDHVLPSLHDVNKIL